jgi:hypothetical protein
MAITHRHKGAREESISTPKLQDRANRGRSFAATIDEKRPTVRLTAPAMGRSRQANKTGSEKKASPQKEALLSL